MMDLHMDDLIHAYTVHDALADGGLHHPYPERWPWLLISAGVHHACNTQPPVRARPRPSPHRRHHTVRAALARGPIERPLVLHHTVAGTVRIAPNGAGGMTLFLPDEE